MSGGILVGDAVPSQAGSTKPGNAVYRPKPKDDPRLRLFCFPYAGSGAAVFRLWPNHLPEDVEVVSLHLPGRAHRLGEPPPTRIEAMVEMAVDNFSSLMERPFAVFGHSLGAVVATEFVRALQVQGLTPVHLFVSSRPPHRDATRQLHQLPDVDFIAAINERYQGIPKELLAHEDLLMLLLPALRADVEALETFNHTNRPKLGCPTSVYGGDADPAVSRVDLDAWKTETTATCQVRVFSGDHFFLNTQTRTLLADVSATLEAYARPRARPSENLAARNDWL